MKWHWGLYSVSAWGYFVPHLPVQIQEQESLIVEKRRECKEIRGAYGNLRDDYDHLRTDFEMRANRLKQVLPQFLTQRCLFFHEPPGDGGQAD